MMLVYACAHEMYGMCVSAVAWVTGKKREKERAGYSDPTQGRACLCITVSKID